LVQEEKKENREERQRNTGKKRHITVGQDYEMKSEEDQEIQNTMEQ
jgi:hypothetical protein